MELYERKEGNGEEMYIYISLRKRKKERKKTNLGGHFALGKESTQIQNSIQNYSMQRSCPAMAMPSTC